MTLENPHMLPKVRSKALRNAVTQMPCYLKLAGFAGMPCNHEAGANVLCHMPTIGKGTGSKVSDLYAACGCSTCHDLLDWERNPVGAMIREKYPQAYFEQLMKARDATMGAWVALGLIQVEKGEIV